MVGKEPSSPLSTADEPHDRPESFCALYHWCESQRGWNRQVDQDRFRTAFVEHLERMEPQKSAIDFREKFRKGAYTDAIVDDAQRLTVTLAIQAEELPEGWTESRGGGNSVEIPKSPLRRPSDFVAWFEFCLENLPKPGTEKYKAASTAIMLWDDYQRAKAWLKQHGFGKLVPRIDPENDAQTTEWLNDQKGIAPNTREAHIALNQLVESMQANMPGSRRFYETTAREVSDHFETILELGGFDGSQPPEATIEPSNTPKKRGRKKGRVASNLKRDKQIYDAWGSGSYSKFADLEKVFQLEKGEAKLAVDRERKRRK